MHEFVMYHNAEKIIWRINMKKSFIFGLPAWLLVFGLVFAGCEAPLNDDEIEPTVPGIPSPRGFSARALSGTSIGLEWQAVSTAVLYNIYWSDDPNEDFSWVDSTYSCRYTDSDAEFLSPGRTYYYAVTAENFYGKESEAVFSSGVTTPASVSISVPDAPIGLATVSVTTSSVSMVWFASDGAASYKIYRSSTSAGTYTLAGTSSTASYTDTGLTASKTYYYKVSAVNGSESQMSAYAYATTYAVASSKPSAPAGVSVSGTKNTYRSSTGTSKVSYFIAVSWSASATADTYKIWHSTSASGSYTLKDTVTGTSASIGVSSNSTAQYIKVSAVNSAGESAQSAQKQVTSWKETHSGSGYAR
jgi:fibronectin type 3 domain-containing protein